MFALGAPVSLGENIPQTDLMTDYAYGVVCAVACYAAILVCPVESSDRIALLVIWSIKVAVALVFMLFYEDFYWFLDSYGYFADPRVPSFSWEGFVIGRGTENIHNLVWLYYRILPESFHALKVLSSFVGLWGIYLFYRAALVVLGRRELRLLYILALFPSILFWSSTLGKEPFALLGIGLYVYGSVVWYARGSLGAIAFLCLGVIIAVLVRSWLGPILLAPILINYLFARQGPIKKGITVLVAAGALAATLLLVFEQFAIEASQDLLQNIDATSRQWSGGGSGEELAVDLTQPLQLLAALPFAMFTALFRPFPGEIRNALGTMAGLENLVLLTLLAAAVIRFRFSELKNPIILWAAVLIVVWTLAYAFISYQNLGTAVRFRLQILPVLLALLVYFALGASPKLNRSPDSRQRIAGRTRQNLASP